MRRRTLTAAVLALWATAAPAQPPEPDPIYDENVEPAQFLQRNPRVDTPGSPGAVADPPSPVVRIRVRVPADAAPGDPLKYLLTVRNESRADAHQVTVRNPLKPDAAEFVRADPPPDPKQSTAQQLVWSFGTLKPGEEKRIELVLKPKGEPTEVRNLAYVRFEHGEAVTTRISRPGVKVTKLAPKEAVKDEPFAVRVVVENTGRVPAEGVTVVETADRAAKVESVTPGGHPTKSADKTQYQWDLGTLPPGGRRVVEYRLTTGAKGDALTTTAVTTADPKVREQAEATTRVLVPGLSLKLTGPGPAAPVGPGEAAEYEITVRNTGTLPAANIRVTATYPAECRLTKKTEGGQIARDGVGWVVPRLDPGEARAFGFSLKSGTSHHRKVTAAVTDARRQTDTKSVVTVFQGTAAVGWGKTEVEPVALAVGRQGTVTVRVRNSGGEAARNVRLTVELPPEVSCVQASDKLRPAARLEFPARTIAAGGEEDWLITYRAEKAVDAAYFTLRLAADALGEQPLETTKSVAITGGK